MPRSQPLSTSGPVLGQASGPRCSMRPTRVGEAQQSGLLVLCALLAGRHRLSRRRLQEWLWEAGGEAESSQGRFRRGLVAGGVRRIANWSARGVAPAARWEGARKPVQDEMGHRGGLFLDGYVARVGHLVELGVR